MLQADTLRLRAREQRWQRLIGLPFLAAGLGALGASAQLRDPETVLLVVLPLLGSLFTLLGGALLYGRLETEIDRAAGTVADVMILFRTLRRNPRPLGDASRVVLEVEAQTQVSADDFQSQRFAVWLRTPGEASEGTRLIAESDYASARSHARTVAAYLDMPLQDLSSDAPDGAGPPLASPRPPPGRRLLREEGVGRAVLRLERPGFRGIHFGYLAVAVVFAAGAHFLFAPELFADMSHPRARLVFGALLYGGFAGVPCLLLALPVLRSLTSRVRLDFDATGLHIHDRWLLGGSRSWFAPGDVEKVDLGVSSKRLREAGLHEGPVVRVIARGGAVVELGTLLARNEARWLRDELRRRVGA